MPSAPSEPGAPRRDAAPASSGDPHDTPMMRQFRAAKERYPKHLLFFRMGDFYELFMDDAKIAARALGLTLTSRSKGPDAIPMAGVPYQSAEGYLARLLRQGFSVAICDQTEDPRKAKGIVKREVTRVVTPGTVVEDNMLDARKPNRLAAVYPEPGPHEPTRRYGLAAADLATGTLHVQELAGWSALAGELARLAPSECLLPEPDPLPPGARPVSALPPGCEGRFALTRLPAPNFEPQAAHGRLTGRFAERGHAQELKKLARDLPLGAAAAGVLAGYLDEMNPGAAAHLRAPQAHDPEAFLELDEAAIHSLELTERLRDRATDGSLLWSIDRTKTGAGARRLREWLLRPLRELKALKARQEAVSILTVDERLREELRALLGEAADLERISARLAASRATPRDLVALKHSLQLLPRFEAALEGLPQEVLAALRARCAGLQPVAERIAETLKDDCPLTITEGGLIRDGFHGDLDRLRGIATGGKEWIAQFQAQEAERSGISNLKIGYNKVFGYYIEVTKSNLKSVPAYFERRQTLANAERYVTPDLKEREAEVLGAEDKIRALETELFHALRDETAKRAAEIQASGSALAELDALASLAETAARKGWVRPELSNGRRLYFEQARHPVLEDTLARGEVIPNDLALEAPRGKNGRNGKEADGPAQIQILTGPNMAGKSTYIRTAALCTILAQMGSFVPADKAEVGLVDRIFTRVGAADDLFGGRSTFMVEMAEVAEILAHASDASLVILDEVGRGTSTYDGVSLAWSIIEYLHEGRARPRTLFATHYHELCGLAEELARVRNASALVKEWQGEITFLYRIVEGPSERSFGLHVARLAGVPKEVIERARSILLELEDEARVRVEHVTREPSGGARARKRPPSQDDGQMLLFEPTAEEIDPRVKQLLDKLRGLNPDAVTPLDALALLADLIKQAKGEK
ncbi:MAG: DNA mismatch repair protein MutS [Planctomycetes bacterium]|nr:DNA mismatch repair protein MutS [Planctomycetota bacterium]